MEFIENMLLQLSGEKTIRIVFCDRLSSIIYAINMEVSRWPYVISKEELISQYQKKRITILDEDPYAPVVAEAELSVAERDKREFAWKIVKYVLEQVDSKILIFKPNYRQKAMKKAIETYGVSYNTVKNYLVQFWKGGKIKDALLPNFRFCGAKGREKKTSDKKRGRPKKSGIQGVNVNEPIKKYFKTGLNRYYYNERNNSLHTTYELILKDFFTEKRVDHEGNELSILQDTSQIPTYHQFLYWYKKMNNPKKELMQRQGTRKYFQNYRTIIGNSTQDAGLGPGTLWQIDSTQFDIYLVSSVNRNLIVGRPTLICCIDVYSRMIVGFNITFESFNSYTGTMVALANSMLPKVDYCKQYGITLNKGDWDVTCVPQRVFADRGELNGKMIEDAIESLGISIQNSPPYRADYKGIIEQTFHQMNIKVKPFADGVVKNGKNLKERGDEDYRLKANLTIDEFTRIIIKCVLFHNNHHVLSQYVLDEMMVAEKVEKTPAKIWDYGVKNMKGHLRVLPDNTIKMHLLPTDTASITAHGVRYKKMLYASKYSLKNHWFQLARINGSKKIKIWYDSRDLTHIYTINKDGEFHQLALLDYLSKYQHKGIYEINKLIEYEASLEDKSKKNELQEKMKLYSEIEEIVKTGRQQTENEKDESLSKNKRLKGIRDNQKMEREIQREMIRKKRNSTKPEDEFVDESNVTKVQRDELGMFKTLQELEWDDTDE